MTHGDTSPAERAGTAQEIAQALRMPASRIRQYASDGAIKAIGRRGRSPVYDGRDVARERARRNATRRSWTT